MALVLGPDGILLYVFGLDGIGFVNGIFWRLVYGIVLFIVAAVFWMKIVLAIKANRQMAMLFLFFHLIYGIVLGAWVGLDLFGL